MSGKIPWYLKDAPHNRDPYARERREIARLRESLNPALRQEWDTLKENYEYFDGETEIELSYLRKFIREHK
jgi:hypothetical protein